MQLLVVAMALKVPWYNWQQTHMCGVREVAESPPIHEGLMWPHPVLCVLCLSRVWGWRPGCWQALCNGCLYSLHMACPVGSSAACMYAAVHYNARQGVVAAPCW